MAQPSPNDFCPLLTTIGGPGFEAALMRLLHKLCGADLCSVFVKTKDGHPSVLIAESIDPAAAVFARIASLRYVQLYWRRDTVALSALGRAHSKVHVLKRPARGILDMEYRHECYTEGKVMERVSLYRGGDPAFIANAYRSRDSGPFAPSHLRAFADIAEVVLASLARHLQLTSAQPVIGDPDNLALCLIERTGLSQREAQVAALTAAGREQSEIAEALGVAPSSVITYRKRAYQKLGAPNRKALRGRISDIVSETRAPDQAEQAHG